MVAVLPAHPADLQAQLESTFRAELARRLPRLLPAVGRLRRLRSAASPATIRAIVAEVHPLASAAVVIGLHDAARAARACEHRLLAYVDGEVLPAVVVSDALTAIDQLLVALQDEHALEPLGIR